MSMYEIESLIEDTVHLIDSSAHSATIKRNLIWNAYQLQAAFDCSFTHFRVMPILIKNDFVQQYDVKDFPMYGDFPSFFSELSHKGFGWIRKNPEKAWSKDNLTVAYWDRKSAKVYADFGSEHYTLHGHEQATEIEPLAFGLQICEEAHAQKRKDIVYDWTAFMITYLLEWFPTSRSLQQLETDYFSRLQTIFQTYDYTDHEPRHPGLDLLSNLGTEWLSEDKKALIRFVGGKS